MGSTVVAARPHLASLPLARVDPRYQTKRGATALGFVLAKVDHNSERDVYAHLLEIDGVREVFPLFGEYDLLIEIEADSYEALGEKVFNGIRRIRQVRSTHTLTATSL